MSGNEESLLIGASAAGRPSGTLDHLRDFFDGTIDNFVVADRALYPAEVFLLHQAGGDFDAVTLGAPEAVPLTLTDDNTGNVLVGDGSDDTLMGYGGNDTLIGGLGADYLNGGRGIDTLDLTASNAAVTVDFRNGTGSGGHAEEDMYKALENVLGSAFADTIVGNNANNFLVGGDGDDTLMGSGGNDTLNGGAGADYLNGGSGIDTLDLTDSDAAVSVNLRTGLGSGGHAQGDTYKSLENVVGSDFSDVLAANNAANRIEGGDGSDILIGSGGADTLVGGDGGDIFRYAAAGHSSPATADVIEDYSSVEGDRIDLQLIDADASLAGNQAFAFIDTAAFSNTPGELHFDAVTGRVEGDTDGDGVADLAIDMNGLGSMAMENFIL